MSRLLHSFICIRAGSLRNHSMSMIFKHEFQTFRSDQDGIRDPIVSPALNY